MAVYANSFSGSFVLDDTDGILSNPTLPHLSRALSPPVHSGVGGRPLLNLSFALNYFLGGLAVPGYHAFNLVVHILAGLVLFGLARRTLLRPPLQARFGRDATMLAWAVALLWLLHPVQTASVTYISQRAESLMGLWYLLTLYCFVRGTASSAPKAWFGAAVAACGCGMATKEVMVTVPLMVLLYDRTFVAGTFREAWRRRRGVYLGLALTWILLGCLMTNLSQRSVGFSHGISGWHYALTECRVVVQYVALSLWPHPLVFDYGIGVANFPPLEAVPFALLLAALLAGTVVALRRRPALGFAGAWFFVILAPTSSVVPVAGQPMAENRLYLPLAAAAVLIVLGTHAFAGRRGMAAVFAMGMAAGLLAADRNQLYRSPLLLWRDTVAKRPENERAHDSLGNALLDAGRMGEAIAEYRRAVGLVPADPREHYNLGHALALAGRPAEAIASYEQALRLKPDYAEARNNLGAALADAGRLDEAVAQYQKILGLQPDNAEAHYNLGRAFQQMNRPVEALAQYGAALSLNPESAATHDNLGNVLAQLGRFPEAVQHYEEALRLDPSYASAHNNLGVVLMKTGHETEALQQYEEALRLNPEAEDAQRNRGDVFLELGRTNDAIESYKAALRLKNHDAIAAARLGAALMQVGDVSAGMGYCQQAVDASPDYAAGHYYLGNALARTGQIEPALREFERAVQLAPDYAEAQNNLGMALMQTGRLPEAIAHFEAAVRLKPDYATAAGNLADARAALAAQNRHD